jgi:predicted amidohydrolase YtcJ
MWTREAAKVIGWDGVGTLEAGNHADIIVLDQDPSSCDIDNLHNTKVMRTMVGGETVFDSGDL